MRKRCIWSNSLDDPVRDVEIEMLNRWGTRVERKVVPVCPAHETEVREFAALVTGRGRLFLPLMLILTVATVVGAFGESRLLAAAPLIGMGILALILPFCTPETVQMMGLETSIRLARISGLILIALGIAILVAP